MKLEESSIRWALDHLFKESDTDLYPRPYELQILFEEKEEVIKLCKNIDVAQYHWKAARRFLIPKDELSFRNATQLDLIDSILIGAIIFQFGEGIEKRRIPEKEKVVFSYRFKPLPDGTLYKNNTAWNDFWENCRITAEFYEYVVICDISDFYNQIYLHTIENQLAESKFPPEIVKKISSLLTSITQKNSRGIPIGPHVSHLLAEMSLIPFDENLSFREIEFNRYVDDIIIFCEDRKEASIRLNQVAEALDKDQRLILQKQKTRIIPSKNFIALCGRNLMEIEDEDEEEIIQTILNYSKGNAYTKIKISDIKDKDIAKLSEENVTALLENYLNTPDPDYSKIRWIYRRLSQVGIASAVEFSINNYDKLIPALNDVCLYLSSCAENYNSDWKDIGEQILDMLEDEIIKSNEFYKISLLNLFVYNPNLNHTASLIEIFDNAPENIKRKILLACANIKSAGSWLNTLREKYRRFDPWTQRAFLIAAKNLPKEARSFFFKSVKFDLRDDDILEKIIIKWAEKQTS